MPGVSSGRCHYTVTTKSLKMNSRDSQEHRKLSKLDSTSCLDVLSPVYKLVPTGVNSLDLDWTV